jgi:hypothetical protein
MLGLDEPLSCGNRSPSNDQVEEVLLWKDAYEKSRVIELYAGFAHAVLSKTDQAVEIT